MGNEDGGGKAFPGAYMGHCDKEGHAPECGCYVDTGMTLRDYFAGKALPAIVAGSMELAKLGQKVDHCKQAKAAYRLADEMLKARLE